MNRKFLEDLGLEKEMIDKILDEHSTAIGKHLKDIETLKTEISSKDMEIQTAKKR